MAPSFDAGLNAALLKIEERFWLTCDYLLMHHTNPWELDEALTAQGFRTGPCEAQDHLGLDQVLTRFAGRGSSILYRMVSEGRLGKIGGVGYYRYPGGGGAVIDPLIEDLILEEARFAKLTRSPMTDAALTDHVTSAIQSVLSDLSVQSKQPLSPLTDQAAIRLHCPPDLLRSL